MCSNEINASFDTINRDHLIKISFFADEFDIFSGYQYDILFIKNAYLCRDLV